MSIETVLTAALFKRDEAGRTLMFPNGVLGRGYIVPDAATEQKMRRTFMWLMIGSGLFGGIGVQIISLFFGHVDRWTATPWAIAFASLVVFVTGYRTIARRLAHGMTPSAYRPGVVESFKRQAEAMPRWFLVFMAVSSALMIVGLACWMFVGASVLKYALSMAGIALFGVVMLQAVHGLTHRAQT